MPLTEDQLNDIPTNLFFVNLTTEVDNTLTSIDSENIGFDGHLFMVVPNEDVPVRMSRTAEEGDITLDIGIGPGEEPANAVYSFTIPQLWLTG